MANKTVSLVRKVKTPDGWRRYPVVFAANGKVKPGAVMVGNGERIFSTGHYELRRYVGSKVAYERVVGNATDAMVSLKQAQKVAHAVVFANDAGVKIVEEPGRVSLHETYETFIQATIDRGSLEAADVYRLALDEFFTVIGKTFVDEVTRADITKFNVALKKRGMSKRTVHNRHQSVRAFLFGLGVDVKVVVGKAPKFDKEMPEIYEKEYLAAFFTSLTNAYDTLLFTILLTTGMREREAMHLEWRDISWSRKTMKVESKPKYGHRIKDSEEREMPLTEVVLDLLRFFRSGQPHQSLAFGRRGGAEDRPDGHLLRRLKARAREAKLNCGTCETCVARNECEKCFLHRFRATYATTLLRSGVDLRTVQRLMGHSDLASTMRYLRPAGTAEVQAKVNAIVWH